jgi:hypothetical protein
MRESARKAQRWTIVLCLIGTAGCSLLVGTGGLDDGSSVHSPSSSDSGGFDDTGSSSGSSSDSGGSSSGSWSDSGGLDDTGASSGSSSDSAGFDDTGASSGSSSGGASDTGSDTACPSGETACSGACVNEQTDDHNCGSCGHVCPSGVSCTNGTCPSLSLVAYANETTSSAATATTPSVSTTGSTLIVAACGWYTEGGSATSCAITDSKGNTWHPLAAYQGTYNGTGASIQASYTIGPSTSASHTFTASTSPSCSGCFADIWVLAFGGVSAGSISFQASCGNTAGSSPASSCSASLLPAQANELMVAFLDTNDAQSSLTYGIDSGFTIVNSIATPSDVIEGGADAYKLQGPSTALNPIWSVTGTESDFATTLAAFKY